MKHGRRLKSIEIRRAVNGVTVRHETEPAKRSGAKSGQPYVSDYEPAQEHAFNDHGAAHAHMTKHLAKLFGSGESDEDPAEEATESPRQEKAEQPKDRKSDVAAFHKLRKGGHLG